MTNESLLGFLSMQNWSLLTTSAAGFCAVPSIRNRPFNEPHSAADAARLITSRVSSPTVKAAVMLRIGCLVERSYIPPFFSCSPTGYWGAASQAADQPEADRQPPVPSRVLSPMSADACTRRSSSTNPPRHLVERCWGLGINPGPHHRNSAASDQTVYLPACPCTARYAADCRSSALCNPAAIAGKPGPNSDRGSSANL